MMRLTNQRGISLMFLIIMITVFAGVAIGTVTLLRARHESYPYQVQSYQALALADAGVQFASRYATDNGIDFTSHPGTYIGSTYSAKNTYSLGNGQFQLRYEPATTCTPGQMGNLYCKGVVGTAAREVKISDFGQMIGKLNGNALLINPDQPWQSKLVADWGGPWPGEIFRGWRVSLKVCGTWEYGQGNIWIPIELPDCPVYHAPIKIAVSYPEHWPNGLPSDPPHPCRKCPPQGGGDPSCTNICESPTGTAVPLYLGRLAVTNDSGFGGDVKFAWDEMCDRGPFGWDKKKLVPHWDGVTIPPPLGQYLQPEWNVRRPSEYRNNGPRTNVLTSPTTWPYCYAAQNIGVGQFWNSDSYPISLDFTDPGMVSEPQAGPTGVKYYVEFPTTIQVTTRYTVTNRYVFTATKAY